MGRARLAPSAPPVSRAGLYLRVSTPRQAEHDLSVPDQRRQLEAFSAGRGWKVAAEFLEPGNTATDDKRPAFQEMIEAAMAKPPPFDVILVHSFSRFFRDQFLFEFYVRKLAKNGVRVVSITQELGDDPMSVMMRKIMTLFDEYQSKENGKHTLRAMKENARQGFWNGSRPPLGYRVITAEQRGAKLKKKLEIDPIQAEKVRKIYKAALQGVDGSGPLGLKSIATWLNDNNIRTKDGGKFGIGAVHQVLTRTTYKGEHRFNATDHKNRRRKPDEEHAVAKIPAIVTEAEWQAVQDHLKQRSPAVMHSRFVNSPVLLGGICFCGLCGGAMTLRTGKNGAYRYYTCSTKARMGKEGCTGITVPMAKLDDAVVSHLERKLIQTDRLCMLMGNVLDRREDWIERRRSHVGELRKRAAEASNKLTRLYAAIEDGLVGQGSEGLRDRIRELEAIKAEGLADADRAEAAIEKLGPMITPESIERMASATREALRNPEGKYRRAQVRAVAQRVEVLSTTEIKIMGGRTELLRTMAASAGAHSVLTEVRSSKPKWRTRHDSNV